MAMSACNGVEADRGRAVQFPAGMGEGSGRDIVSGPAADR